MVEMLYGAKIFNQDIGNWDVSNVVSMKAMFSVANEFNQDLGSWDVSNVTNMVNMFADATDFSQDLSNWCVTSITSKPIGFDNLSSLIASQLPVWGTCPGTIPTGGFVNANGCVECDSLSIGSQFLLNGDTMLVADRAILDSLIAGNHDLTKVCVSHVTLMNNLFYEDSTFNQPISNWDVSNVTSMHSMFLQAVSFQSANWKLGRQ
jgi:surface protein